MQCVSSVVSSSQVALSANINAAYGALYAPRKLIRNITGVELRVLSLVDLCEEEHCVQVITLCP